MARLTAVQEAVGPGWESFLSWDGNIIVLQREGKRWGFAMGPDVTDAQAVTIALDTLRRIREEDA